jgi:hypothetical protein
MAEPRELEEQDVSTMVASMSTNPTDGASRGVDVP